MFLLDGAGEPRLVHSASDLVVAAECEHALLRRLDEVLGRVPQRPRDADEMLARTVALGEAHEASVLEDFRARFGTSPDDGGPGGVLELPAPRRMAYDDLVAAHSATLAGLERGADVVYQAAFFDGSFHGRADFLVRDAGPSDGRPRYAVWDTKLARREKVRAVLQLAAYADQLLAAGIDPTEHAHLVLGTGEITEHALAEVLPVFRARRDRLLDVVARHVEEGAPVEWDAPGHVACQRLGVCPDCAESAATHSDVLLVAGVYAPQRARLAAAGLTTMKDLACAEQPPAGMAADRFAGLQRQAALQLGTDPGDGSVLLETPEGSRELRWALTDPAPVERLPPPSDGDVFFDFEGDPLWAPADALTPAESGIDYLFGWVTRDLDAEGRPSFHALWADTWADEADALVRFVDAMAERRRRWPDMHVYHYAAYERTHLLSIAARHGVYEDEVDELLRSGVLVDLYATVRSAIRISDRSRSIKKLEPLYMGDEAARSGVTDAATSVVEYAEYCELLAAGEHDEAAQRREEILDYNRYDCLSTLRLLDWLRWAHDEVVGPVERPVAEPLPLEEPTPENPERAAREALEAEIRDAVAHAHPHEPAERAAARALSLLGAAVGYHRREGKQFWQAHFSRMQLPPAEWPGRRSAAVVEGGRVLRDWEVEPGKRAPSRLLALACPAVEGSELRAGASAFLLYDVPCPPVVANVGPLAERWFHGKMAIAEVERVVDGDRELDVFTVREHVGAGQETHDDLPCALSVNSHVPAGPLETATEEAGRAALEAWRSGAAAGVPMAERLPAGPMTDLLQRRPARVAGGLPTPAVGPDGEPDVVAAVERAVRALDRSYLAVQGPPGTGKTYLASHVIAALVADGWRVGVVAQSHAVVENLLHGVLAAGVPAEQVAKKLPSGVSPAQSGTPWQDVNADGLQAFAAEADDAGRGCVVGGTAWDFAHDRWAPEGLDLLVIDEAGQFAIANTVAVARAAARLLLLGDPQQLPQVSQGAHPDPGVAGSALGWLADGHETLPEEFGYFLPASRRMHPALCTAVSELAYSGRLHAHASVHGRSLDPVEPGVHEVLVDHAGRAVSSAEEAEEVVRQVRAVLGRPWVRTVGAEPRDLGPADVIVVAAYNAQVHTIRRALARAGLDDVRVGTVDKFQGQEAPVAVLSMAASSPEDVPRGMGFLLSRNRINVAVSRGQWRAVVIRSPRLTDYLPTSVTDLQQLGAFLRLTAR
ncbi:TM0106 family RecB-like putative nuclease [Isoptericola sp. b408]|uniref:TM0106 family RecB-like putative nuclease n=1 Tax=Isoptericola sp. b408 TaxID=3064653 RepID=UPI002713B863|nr:TM0106 family RecB-like putative nuclease [Isoptericola sp. b408]MDO8150150.1 TM0106 family RecB-like putative nuclease [Isoptericola sp. b408]